MKPPQTIPAYEIVLSEEQLEDLGRFTAIFSQIDGLMFQIIANASKMQSQDLMALIEGTTAGQRLAMLRRLAGNMEDKKLREMAEGVCSGLHRLNGKRNHILHGIWGLQWDTQKDTLKPACAYERDRQNPLYAKQLPELCERAAKLSHKVMDLLVALNPSFAAQGGLPRRLVMASGPPPGRHPPEWQLPLSRRCPQQNPKC